MDAPAAPAARKARGSRAAGRDARGPAVSSTPSGFPRPPEGAHGPGGPRRRPPPPRRTRAPPGRAVPLTVAPDAAPPPDPEGIGLDPGGTERLSGDLRTVLRAVKDGTSARILIVDLDGTDYAGGGLHELAQWCAPETVVIAVGSDASAERTREIMQAGVGDYLVKPVEPAVLEAALQRLDAEPEAAAARGTVAAFASASGAGATTMAGAVAVTAARAGHYVTCVDLNRLFPALAFLLRTEVPPGLEQLLAQAREGNGDAGAISALRGRVDERLDVLGYRFTGALAAAPELQGLAWLLDHLAREAHLVVVDGLGAPWLRFQLLNLVDARVLVAGPSPGAAGILGGSLRLLSAEIPTWTVVNHTRSGRRRRGADAFEEQGIRVEKALTVPYDPRLGGQSDRGWEVRDAAPKPLRAAAETLSRRLLGG